jgi:hypothetical protein
VVALAVAAACTHPHLSEGPVVARFDPGVPRLDAKAKAAANAQFLHRGRLVSRVFSSDELGLTVQINPDMMAEVPPDGAELELQRGGTYGSLGRSTGVRASQDVNSEVKTASLMGDVYFFFEPLSVDLEAEMTERLARRVQPGSRRPVRVRESYAIELPVGLADVNEVELDDAVEMKVAYVAACRGAATLVLLGAWEGPQGDAPTERWFDGVRPLDVDAPACAYFLKAQPASPAAPAGALAPAAGALVLDGGAPGPDGGTDGAGD